jgi:hypothetical protein
VLVGATIGVLTGIVVLVNANHRCNDVHTSGPPCGLVALIALPIVLTGGAIVGGLGGALVPPAQWIPVAWPNR